MPITAAGVTLIFESPSQAEGVANRFLTALLRHSSSVTWS